MELAQVRAHFAESVDGVDDLSRVVLAVSQVDAGFRFNEIGLPVGPPHDAKGFPLTKKQSSGSDQFVPDGVQM